MSEAHSPYLHHHFDTLEQQRQASSLGMWVFIAQEIMFFGGLFLGYTYYRTLYPEAFSLGSKELSLAWGSFNTVVLICSSLTVALSVHAAQLGNKRGNLLLLDNEGKQVDAVTYTSEEAKAEDRYVRF